MKPENEKVIKPCYVCGNAFEGLKYCDSYEMCPTCYKGLMQVLRKEKNHEQMQEMQEEDPLG